MNEKLSSITRGNMDETIDIQSSLEFSELSDHLNRMIKSLLENNEKMSYVLSKTNLYIGIYEYNSYMKKVRFTEYIPKIFDLDAGEMEELSSDYKSFRAFIDKLHENPVMGEPGIFQLSGDVRRYVRLEENNGEHDIFGVAIDVTEDILRRKKIERERDMDQLTGLLNRRGLDNRLSILFQEPEKLGCSAFVMIDADGLKMVNDTYGHEKGDSYLKKISGIIETFNRKGSVAARQGGDEFLLFLYQYEGKRELLREIHALREVQDGHFVELDSEIRVPLRFSFGYVFTGESTDYHGLIKKADERMYRNKRKRKT